MKLILLIALIPILSLSKTINPLQDQVGETLVKVLPDKILFMDKAGKATRTVPGNFEEIEQIKLSPNGDHYLLVNKDEIQFFNKNDELLFHEKTTRSGRVSSISFINNKTPVVGSDLGIIEIFKKENKVYKKTSKQYSELPIVNISASRTNLIIEQKRYHKEIGFRAKITPTSIYDLPRENQAYRPAGFVLNQPSGEHSGFVLEKIGFTNDEIKSVPISEEDLNRHNLNRKASNQRDLYYLEFDENLNSINEKAFLDDYTFVNVNPKNQHLLIGLKEENIMVLINTETLVMNNISGYGDIVEFDHTNSRILITNVDSQLIRILDSNTGQIVKTISTNLEGISAMKIIDNQLLLATKKGHFEKRLLSNLEKNPEVRFETNLGVPAHSEIKVFANNISILDQQGELHTLDIKSFSECIPLLK